MFQAVDISSELIKKANSVPILEVASRMGLLQDASIKKICCPFSFHKNGSEKTPSFYFYQDTNSFYCYGCKKGGGTTDFVSSLTNESKILSAQKIISFEIDQFVKVDNSKKYIMEDKYLLLSQTARAKMIKNGISDVEDILKAFDFLIKKYEDSPDKLSSIFDKIINRIKAL